MSCEDSKQAVVALRARLTALQAVRGRPEGTEDPAVAIALEALLTAATAEARYLLDQLPGARRRGPDGSCLESSRGRGPKRGTEQGKIRLVNGY